MAWHRPGTRFGGRLGAPYDGHGVPSRWGHEILPVHDLHGNVASTAATASRSGPSRPVVREWRVRAAQRCPSVPGRPRGARRGGDNVSGAPPGDEAVYEGS